MKGTVKFPALRRRKLSTKDDNAETAKIRLREDIPDVFVKAVQETYSDNESGNGYVVYQKSSELTTNETRRNVCKHCKQGIRNSEQYNEELLTGEVSDSVLAIAHQLQTAKEQRKIDATKDHINEIMQRVSSALEHSGFEFINGAIQKFNVGKETARHKERNNIFGMFERSATLSKSRDGIIEEIDTWLEFLNDDLSNFCQNSIEADFSNEEHFHRINVALKKSTKAINRLSNIMKKAKQSRNVSGSVNESNEYEPADVESKDSIADSLMQEHFKIFKKLYTEKELIQAKHTKSVVKMIITILEDGAKSQCMPNQMKANFKIASKQFKIFATVHEGKLVKVNDLEEKIKQFTSDVTNMKYLEEQKIKDQQKLTKITEKNILLEQDVEKLQQHLNDMENKLVMNNLLSQQEPEISIRLPSDENISDAQNRQQSKSILPRTISRQVSRQVSKTNRSYAQINEDAYKISSMARLKSETTPESLKEDTPVSHCDLQKDISSSESEHSQELFEIRKDEDFESKKLQQHIQLLNEKLIQAECTIEKQQAEMDRMKSNNQQQQIQQATRLEKEIKKIEMQLAKVENDLLQKIEELQSEKETNEQLQQQLKLLMDEKTKLQEEIENMKTNFDIKDMPRDQLISKLKSQFEKDSHRLKNFIIKEQQRFQATLRKVHLENKKYVTILRNEKTQMMRSLTRFKNVVTHFMYQEDEQDDSNDYEIQNEDNEKKYALYQAGANIPINIEPMLEMLVMLENNLNKVLLKKRLVVKYANSSKSTTDKSLHQYRERLQKTTNACNEQEKLVTFQTKCNKRLIDENEKMRLNNENLQKEIAPSKELLEKYNSLKRNVERLNSEGKEYAHEKNKILQEFDQDRSRLKQELQKLSLTQGSQGSWQEENYKEKIQLVNKAYEENRISAKDQDIAAQILSYSSKIVKKELSSFVKRYISFKKLEVVKDTMIRLGETYKGEVRFKNYLTSAEERYEMAHNAWLKKKHELRETKENECLLFTELLRQKHRQDLEVTSSSITKPKKITRKQNKMYTNVSSKKSPPTQLLENIVGHRLSNENDETSYWQMPPSAHHTVHIHTPKIVEMDVNGWQRNLKKQTNKQVHFPAIATLFP